MLSPEVIKKIKKVHIKCGRKVNTLMAGQYKSVFRGSGIEFEEVREYVPGDEIKSIDWKVSARMGRPFLKRYREERELIVMLLIDMSASGQFGTTHSLKNETAAEIAAILAFNAIKNNDKVGAILFSDRVEAYIPPKKGSSHVWRVIKEIFTFQPTGRQTDIASALEYLGRVCRKKSVSFLISDFLSPEYAKRLRTVSQKHEFIGIMVSDPGEFTLPKAGIINLIDFETGTELEIDAFDRRTRETYEELRRTEYKKNLDILKAADIDCIEIRTDGSAADALTRYFRLRERRKHS